MYVIAAFAKIAVHTLGMDDAKGGVGTGWREGIRPAVISAVSLLLTNYVILEIPIHLLMLLQITSSCFISSTAAYGKKQFLTPWLAIGAVCWVGIVAGQSWRVLQAAVLQFGIMVVESRLSVGLGSIVLESSESYAQSHLLLLRSTAWTAGHMLFVFSLLAEAAPYMWKPMTLEKMDSTSIWALFLNLTLAGITHLSFVNVKSLSIFTQTHLNLVRSTLVLLVISFVCKSCRLPVPAYIIAYGLAISGYLSYPQRGETDIFPDHLEKPTPFNKPSNSPFYGKHRRLQNVINLIVLAAVVTSFIQAREINYPITISRPAPLLDFPRTQWGNLDRFKSGPLPHYQKRRQALLVMPIGWKARHRVDALVKAFSPYDVEFLFFHYDDSTWNEYAWYSTVTTVRSIGMQKWWFAKRFMTADVVERYKHILFWDDDIEFAQDYGKFDVRQLFNTLNTYNIHFAQPAIQAKNILWDVVAPRYESVGRWTTFIEVMVPIVSSEAWINCVHPMLQPDDTSGYGVDVHWYSFCAPLGYCTMAVLDSHVVTHLDQKSTKSDGRAYEPKREEEYWEILGRVACVRNEGSCGFAPMKTIKSIEPTDANWTMCPAVEESWGSRNPRPPLKRLLQ